MTFNTETLINAGKTFLMLFGELFGLFIGISFVVALLQVYISQERIKRILTTPRKGLNSVLGALLAQLHRSAPVQQSQCWSACLRAGHRFAGRFPFC